MNGVEDRGARCHRWTRSWTERYIADWYEIDIFMRQRSEVLQVESDFRQSPFHFFCWFNFVSNLCSLCSQTANFVGISGAGVLANYRRIAEGLYARGYYSGLLSAVESCLNTVGTFVILDCPSGTGKTLAAVALSMQSCNKNQNSKLAVNGLPADVYHFIWPTAVGGQDIYKEINRTFPLNSKFFSVMMDVGETAGTAHLWAELKRAIPEIDVEAITSCKRVLVLIIDEVPEDPVEIQRLRRIRDALKSLLNICLLLCGTHSKAANMVDISKTSASRTENLQLERWAWIVTRLPRFDLEISGLQIEFETATKREDFVYVVNAISLSVMNGGNPWLIKMAITSALEIAMSVPKFALRGAALEKAARDRFVLWQDHFSHEVFGRKFNYESISGGFKGLSAQLSLLLDASATSRLSDVLLGYHFAMRCIPDSGRSRWTGKRPDLNDCGGCLYLALPKSRAAGNSLLFFRGRSKPEDGVGFASWQTTSFATPQNDLLLYLMACRKQGYLTTFRPAASFRTYEVLLSCWRSNSAGLINFQNPSAVGNSGSLLEVLLAAGVKNAAARKAEGGIDCSAVKFLAGLMSELGLGSVSETPDEIEEDATLNEIHVPRIIVPAQESQCQQFAAHGLGSILGIAEGKQNKDDFDLLVKGIDSAKGSSIRLEAKDRGSFNTGELASSAAKLFRNGNRVGIIVVRNCCQYWGDNSRNITNRNTLKELLVMIRGLGKAYLFSSALAFVEILVSSRATDKGRLVVIQVPETSLRELYPGA